MPSWDKIITSAPLDGQAKSVTSQKDVSDSVEMDISDKRESLRRQFQSVCEALRDKSKLRKAEVVALTKRHADLAAKLGEIKKEIKKIRPTDDKAFVYAAVRILPSDTINKIRELAHRISEDKE